MRRAENNPHSLRHFFLQMLRIDGLGLANNNPATALLKTEKLTFFKIPKNRAMIGRTFLGS